MSLPKTQYKICYPQNSVWCNDEVSLDVMYDKPTPNQQLANAFAKHQFVGNPKTRIAPVITPPSADISVWKANSQVQNSAINSKRPSDVYRSGYDITEWCSKPKTPYTSYQNCPRNGGCNTITRSVKDILLKEGFEPSREKSQRQQSQLLQKQSQQPLQQPFLIKKGCDVIPYIKNIEDSVDTDCCGYDPSLLDSNLPINYAAGRCTRDTVFDEYNKNIFTSTIQPSLYTQTRINEPINSNIGISFVQSNPPMRCIVDQDTGEMTYVEQTPEDPLIREEEMPLDDNEYPYDPRFTGYGADNRSYLDPLLGQTKYYYDDINASRMPNYIVRSKIDMFDFGDTYGPLTDETKFGNPNTGDIRELAEQAFVDNTIAFRSGLQESLMRKKNAESWQRRVAPIRTNGMFMAGGLGSCK